MNKQELLEKIIFCFRFIFTQTNGAGKKVLEWAMPFHREYGFFAKKFALS